MEHKKTCTRCSSPRMKGYSMCYQCAQKKWVSWHKNNPGSRQERKWQQSHGLDFAGYGKLFDKQKGLCAICKRPERMKQREVPRKLAVDHCHSTQEIRGLLCFECNTRLGIIEHRTFAAAAALYLNKIKGKRGNKI